MSEEAEIYNENWPEARLRVDQPSETQLRAALGLATEADHLLDQAGLAYQHGDVGTGTQLNTQADQLYRLSELALAEAAHAEVAASQPTLPYTPSWCSGATETSTAMHPSTFSTSDSTGSNGAMFAQ